MMHRESVDRLPPGSSGSAEEDLRLYAEDPYRCLEALSKEHGTIFSLKLGELGNGPTEGAGNNGYWVFLTRPHQIRLMYQADGSAVSGAAANKLFFGTNEASVGYIEGSDHKRRRSQLHPVFNGSRDYTALIDEVSTRCIAEWPRGRPFSLFLELQRLTSNIIAEIVCGNMAPRDREQLCAMMPRTEGARFRREEVLEADRAIRSLIDERIGGHLGRSVVTGRQDVLAMLLELAGKGDTSLSREVVRDEVFSLLYTGFSTTANTLSWAFVRVLTHEDVHDRLTEELREVVGDGPLSRGKLDALLYLDATLKETLRLHPVTPLNGVRMLKTPMEIDGFLLPAGTILVHCAYLLQRSPDVYPDPEVFSPERFLGKRTDPYTWGAFGGGDRICIGRGLALEEMRFLLAKMLSELRMELLGGIPGAKQQGFFMAPANGAPCVVTERKHRASRPAPCRWAS
ncbi:cytochrome P450 [Sorangium sp. So ce321]|uniref:cytochrome P450 n=1 Tax=Sorangium sp. So ce321 TaxID=3133300 RepID=UPI003F5E07C0